MSPLETSDEHLIRSVASGNEASFQTLYSRYWSKLVYFLMRAHSLNRETAEDLGQDVFSDLLKQAGRFDGRTSFTTWLFGIARKKGLHALRSARTRAARGGLDASSPEAGVHIAGAGEAEREELSECIAATFGQLPEEWRTALYLRERNGLAYKEISEIMEAPVSSVETWLHRGRKKFIEIFSREHKEFLHDLR